MARRTRIKGPRDLARLDSRSRQSFFAAVEAVSDARRKGTTIAAEVERLQARGVRVSRDAVRRFFGDDLERGPGGWSVPKAADRSYHGDMFVVSTDGVVERPVRGSRARSLIAEHANAVKRYLHGHDPDGEGLHRFKGRRVAGVELETDRDVLDHLADAGELHPFDIYADRA